MTRSRKRVNRQVKVVEKVVAVKRNVGRKRKQRKRVRRSIDRMALTPAGKQFLQCTIAPKDFPGLRPGGVPDEYGGGSFTYRHKAQFPITIGGGKQYIVVLPTPGVAYWQTNADPNTGPTLQPVLYPDFGSFFGSILVAPYGTTNVNRFRYLSMIAELKQTGPILSSGGYITAARAPAISMVEQLANTTGNVSFKISGLDDIDGSHLMRLPGSYTGHVNDGVYGFAVNESGDWDFKDLTIATTQVQGVDANELLALNGNFMGYGNMSPLCIAIEGSNANTTFILEVECCIEYAARAGSLMSNMMAPSPPHDAMALELYSKAAREMPAFVRAHVNAGFWDRFLGIVSGLAGGIAPFLGPVGMGVATGVSTVAGALRQLFV